MSHAGVLLTVASHVQPIVSVLSTQATLRRPMVSNESRSHAAIKPETSRHTAAISNYRTVVWSCPVHPPMPVQVPLTVSLPDVTSAIVQPIPTGRGQLAADGHLARGCRPGPVTSRRRGATSCAQSPIRHQQCGTSRCALCARGPVPPGARCHPWPGATMGPGHPWARCHPGSSAPMGRYPRASAGPAASPVPPCQR